MSAHPEGYDWIPFTDEVFEHLGTGDKTGFSIDIMPDNDIDNTTVIIGRPYYSSPTLSNIGAISVYRYSLSTRTWSQKGNHVYGTIAEELLGSSVCMNANEDCFVAGAPGYANNTGAVYAYVWTGVSWAQDGGRLTGVAEGDAFGTALAGSRAANEALIGAPYTSTVNLTNVGAVYDYEFKKSTGVWTLNQTIYGFQDHEHFGSSVQGSSNLGRFVVGSPNATNTTLVGSGRVSHYSRSGKVSSVDFMANGTSDFDYLGSRVSMSFEGDYFAVTTANNSEIDVYNNTGGSFTILGTPLTGI